MQGGAIRLAALLVSVVALGGCAVVEGYPGYRSTVSVHAVQPVYPSPKVYYEPAPVYVTPAPVYVMPAPTYIAPPRVFMQPPVYGRPPVAFGFKFRSGHHHHRHGYNRGYSHRH